MREREREREAMEIIFMFLGFTAAIGAHSISQEVAGFSPLSFSQGKLFLSRLLCLLLCMLFSQIRS